MSAQPVPGAAAEPKEARPSYIAPDLVVRGKISCAGDLHVGGRIEGEVTCGQISVIGGGAIDGVVHAERLTLESGSQISGDVWATLLGVKGDARVSARVHARGAQRAFAADNAEESRRGSSASRSSVAEAFPAA
ncbi:hypothetical protein CKO38_01675 [Rhodospirillum rubrum]|uniref:bactofilin family protein n=1 Tax=Rhodospirillum rubrum TaxID=1085 RepID=UPI00190760DC|nr:polymer-forming cytoskeletal protein [Rhodospirillum rubrum]MBK1663411.1 hypothetical protein [Rhodospirillum rubrum]MBK1675406.1 hypothetical protein [Rhodospirillum rubrum]